MSKPNIDPTNLRVQVIKGGTYLAVRQVFGVGIAFAGMLLLTRVIGPEAYGLYFTAFGVCYFLSQFARVGADVYLVRRRETPTRQIYDQTFSLLLLIATGFALVGLGLSPLLGIWFNDSRVLAPLWALLILFPMNVLTVPAVAQLERALDYANVAKLELVELVLYYVTAGFLAIGGFGVWSPVIGYGVSQVWLLVGGLIIARYAPRWYWSPRLLREMLNYGVGYSLSIWIWQARPLASALVVGHFLGPQGVAFVALASRVIEGLGFIKTATWRLSIATLAKVQQDWHLLRAALEEAMGLQVMALGPLLAGFALIAPLLLPLLYGAIWQPMLIVYPFIALGVLINAIFNMHASILYVLGHNREVAVFSIAHITLLVAAGLVFVPTLGLVGWGIAEVTALASYWVLHEGVERLFTFGYARVLPWLVGFVAPLFAPLVQGPFTVALWLGVLVIPFSWVAREQVHVYWRLLRRDSVDSNVP